MLGAYYGALDIAKTAIMIHQKSIEVVSHNIANVNTPGYTRQEAILETADPIKKYSSKIMFGAGVSIRNVSRVYDQFINSQILESSELLGRWDAQKNALSQVEIIFNESPEYGLNNIMNDFWGTWHDLAVNPEGSAERTSLISQAETLAATINQMDADLRQLQENMDMSIKGTIEEINQITSQITGLNTKISGAEAGGVEANDLRDRRDLLLSDLSELIDFNSFEGGDGKVTVIAGNGKPLVEGITTWELRGVPSPGNSNFLDVNWVDSEGNLTDITSGINGGKLKGWIEMRDTIIPEHLSKLDDLAKEIIEEVNRLHSQGVGLDGFTDLTGTFGVNNPANNLDSANLPFTPNAGSFTIEVMDATGAVVNTYNINVDPTTESLNDLVNNINAAVTGGEITAEVTTDGELRIYSNDPAAHSFAFTSDDSDTLMSLGMNTFFTAEYNSINNTWEYAKTMGVNPLVSNDISKVAAASQVTAPGDGSNADAIANLQDALLMDNNKYTFGDYYNSLVGKIGGEAWKSDEDYKHQVLVIDQLENYRESISGVSLDEEMINLVKFQSAYEAAARLVSVVDEMLDTMINMA